MKLGTSGARAGFTPWQVVAATFLLSDVDASGSQRTARRVQQHSLRLASGHSKFTESVALIHPRRHSNVSLNYVFLGVTSASIPLTDHSCKADADCGWHARCDLSQKKPECASLELGEDIRADVAMCVLGFFIAACSLAAGIGGGGLNVPLLMSVLSFDAHVATAMSQAMLTGGAVAAYIYNRTSHHPARPERSLINYELASLIGACVVSGAQIGSLLHAMAPPAIIVLLLVIVLLDAARKGVINANKITAAEAAASKVDKVGGDHEEIDLPDPHAEAVKVRGTMYRNYLLLFWGLCIVLIVSKNVFFKICTNTWWVMTIGAVLTLGGLSFKIASDLSTNKPVDEYDIDFEELAFPVAKTCVFAGALAALCGIGGGMVIGPILVQMKVPPAVVAATTATTLMVLASSTALIYICRGTMPWRYALLLSACTTVGAGVGKVLVGRWVKRTGKQSAIVWALAIITILSTVLMGYQGIVTVVENGWSAFYFRPFCGGHRSDLSPQEEITDIPHHIARHFFFF